MRVIKAPEELGAGGPVALAIGMFDGVHLGHQQVIRQTLADAEQHEAASVVVTFDKHPSSVVAPERVPPLIYSLGQKLRAIDSLNPDATWLIPFDAGFASQSGEEFIERLMHGFGRICSICVGSNFVFGRKRSGNVALLKELGARHRFVVHGLAAVALDEKTVSSTRIRDCIRAGQLDAASQMLGRAYALGGEIVRGDQLGRRLGFPTANIHVIGRIVPPSGVYIVHAHVAGRVHRAVLNIGVRPTLASPTPELRVEAHLLGFSHDIYGQEIEVTFINKLRDEQRFPSVEALQKQIAADVATAEAFFRSREA